MDGNGKRSYIVESGDSNSPGVGCPVTSVGPVWEQRRFAISVDLTSDISRLSAFQTGLE